MSARDVQQRALDMNNQKFFSSGTGFASSLLLDQFSVSA